MKHYIFRFDVAVNDLEGMDLVDSFTDLLHDGGGLDFSHGLGLSQLVIELPSCADLKDDVDVGGVIEEPIHLDDVGMVQVGLDILSMITQVQMLKLV